MSQALQRAPIHRAHQPLPHLRQSAEESREQHSLLFRRLTRKPARTMKRDHGLASARAATNPRRTIEVGSDDRPL